MVPVAHDSASAPGGAATFPPTLWSMVLQASATPSPQSEKAFATLCAMYWYPLYAHLRRQGCSPHDAQDFTQGFIAHLLGGHKLGQVRREKGRFRMFLRAALHNYLCDERAKAHAIKRGGAQPAISLDAAEAEKRYELEPADTADPERIFERRWAMTLLDRVLNRLEAECKENRHPDRFEALHRYLLGDPDADSYAQVATRLGMSEGAVKVAVLRLRQRYRELFREVVADTVGNDAEVEDEMRHIFSVLCQ
jgi:RNA polymerase sigma factor (sigma-70 family)